MDQEEWRAEFDEQRKKNRESAILKVSVMDLPKSIDLPWEIIGLGKKVGNDYKKIKEEMYEKFGDSLPIIVAVSLHEYWFYCWDGALFVQSEIQSGSMNNNEYTQRMTTAEGYADREGWANAMANAFADLAPSEERKRCIRVLMDSEILDISTGLNCMALYWINQAAIEVANSNIDAAFDFVEEAFDALKLDRAHIAWDDAWNEAIKDGAAISAKEVRSDLARAAARRAHEETRALKNEVLEYWNSNINISLSNEAAARILARQFPLTVRTLSQYVSDFKRTPC